MALISVANMNLYCDYLAAVYTQILGIAGTEDNLASPIDGTSQNEMLKLQNLVLGLDEYEQEIDLLQGVNTGLNAIDVESMLTPLGSVITTLAGHIQTRGNEVNVSIIDIDAFLAYYNGGGGGSLFSSLLTPDFAFLSLAVVNTQPAATGIMSPALSPAYITPWQPSGTYPNGMGTKTVAGVYTQGALVNTNLYQCVLPVIEVLTTFASGSAAPTVTLTGTDDLGNAATWGPTTVTGGNNPASALSGITVTPAITTTGRQTVALSSTTGIVPGSVLTINNTLVDSEIIIVEAVSGSNITAVFQKHHAGSATVTGVTSTVMGVASTGAGRRCAGISAITLGLSSHSVGAIRISGKQDRVAF
jgi:hypothetical protein